MRRVIRRRIRHTQDGLDVAVDFNADVAINVGQSGATTTAAPEEPAPAEDPAPPEANEEEGTHQ